MIKLYIYCSAFIIGHLVVGQVVGMKFHQVVMEIVSHDSNTELRTTIITEIKGLSIQTQQNTFVLFTLFKLTLDERKTLTKIPTRKTSHNHSPKQAQASNNKRSKETSKQGKEQSNIKRRKGCLYNWWRIRSIRISSRNYGRIKKTTRLVLYQTLHYFVPD